jgi:peptide/nickel transport system substrate-binding protein
MAENPKADLLVIGNTTTSQIDGFDLTQAFDREQVAIAKNVSESLVLFDYHTMTLQPSLAESWEIAPDAASITFNLRQGVKWHNGDDFTADDVKFSFDRTFFADHPHNEGGSFAWVSLVPFYESTEVIDDRTVKVNMSSPDAVILARFSLSTMGIVHPPSVMEHGNAAYHNDPSKFVGTGPYKAVALDPNVETRLARNDDWWGPKPDFKEIVVRRFDRQAGGNPQLNALLAGELDVAISIPGSRRNEVFRAPGISAKYFPTLVLGYFWINTTFPLFQDPLVRQAVSHTYDRDTYYEATAGPTTIPWSKYWFPGSPYLNEDADVGYDPDKVIELMGQAGFSKAGDGVWTKADGTRAEFKLQYRAQPGSPAPDEQVFWQQGLLDQGFDVELEVWDPGLPFSRTGGGVFDKENLNLANTGVGANLGDPSFGMQRWTIDEPFNFSWLDNEEMNQLYIDQNVESDPQKRIALVMRMQELAAELIPWIPTSVPTIGAAWWNDKVTNVTAGGTFMAHHWTYKAAPA